MGFDIDFFKELQSLTEDVISSAKSGAYLPRVEELKSKNLVSGNFYEQTVNLVKTLHLKSKKRYLLDFEFQVYPQHIFSFTKGKATRKQLSIGFTAGINKRDFTARIGLGFFLNSQVNPKGVTEHIDFLTKVNQDTDHFDSVFSKIGSYGEPPEYFNPKLISSLVLQDRPHYDNNDWRFYGKLLNLHDDNDVLLSIDRFVDVAISVFDDIRKAGYY